MKKVKMQLFGSFSLTYGDAVLREETLRSNKITRMLVYFLLNRDNILQRQRLIEVMWDEDTKNPEGALKNLMYRIRTVMKTLGDEEFICTVQRGYRWNPEIEVESDCETLEKMGEQLARADSLSKAEKKKICTEILNCYQNNVTTVLLTESWMHSRIALYQSIFISAGKMLCEILEEEHEWEALEVTSTKVLQTDPLDADFHGFLLNSMYAQKKYDRALVQYEKSKKILYENMRTIPTEKFRRIFNERMSELNTHTTDIAKLLEEAKEQEKPSGVFFCDYQIFRQIYRMELRRMERLEMAEHAMLLTLRRKESGRSPGAVDYIMKEGMEVLEQSIRSCLRTGDIASRYSYSQFIVLLPMCNYDSGIKVAKRIQKSFREKYGRRGLELTYELAAVGHELF